MEEKKPPASYADAIHDGVKFFIDRYIEIMIWAEAARTVLKELPDWQAKMHHATNDKALRERVEKMNQNILMYRDPQMFQSIVRGVLHEHTQPPSSKAN